MEGRSPGDGLAQRSSRLEAARTTGLDPVKFGVHLPQWGPLATREAVLAVAGSVEECGFDSAWVADHVVYPLKGADRYPYGSGGPPFRPEDGFLEAFGTLAVVAGATSRIMLGTSALVLPMREPVLTAKSVATLDVLSGGRTILAVGGGWWSEEFAALGAPFAARARRFDESIQLMRTLWAQGSAEHRGDAFSFEQLACEPRPLQPGGPPIWIAGAGAAARRRAARIGDGWHPIGLDAEQLEAGRAEIDELALAEGREPGQIGLSTVIGVSADPARAVERLLELARAGVGHVVLAVSGDSIAERCAAVERAATEVLPALRRELR